MPNPAKVLARLTPKISALDALPGGGIPELTPADVAQALAGLRRGPYLYALALWTEDRGALQVLKREVFDLAQRSALRGGWTNGKTVVIERIAELAVLEHLSPRHCPDCEGRGEIRTPHPVTCPACHGYGRVRVPRDVMAEFCCLEEGEWKRVWETRQDKLYRILAGWASEAQGHLRRRLFPEEGDVT